MTRRYDRMRFQGDERINWSLEELKELVNNKDSQVHVIRTKRHIALYPYHLTNLKKSLHEILAAEINRYDHELKGLLLAYKNPKLLSPVGTIFYDTPFIHVDVEADFYVFKPEIDSVLKGIINKKAGNHIGVLVHKVFNVSIPKEDEEDENWRGHYYDVGDEVKFTVKHMDFKGRLPFIRGTLISSDDDVNDTSAKKSKKHKFTDEELDLNDEDPPESHTNNNVNNSKVNSKKLGFLASINNASSSESEDGFAKLKKSSDKNAKALNGRKKIIKGPKAAETSSDDSDSEVEVPSRITERESPKKLAKENPVKSVLNNSSKNRESSESSSSKIKAESPKKSKKHKLDNSAEEIEKDSSELPGKVSRKRKHLESQNPDDSDEHSAKIKKSKKSKKSSVIIDESFNQGSTIKEKIKREKEIIDKSFDNKSKEEKKSKRERKEDKKDRKHKKKLEEEVEMPHILPLKKIKVEKDDENIPKTANVSKRNEEEEKTIDNSRNDASNHEDYTSVPKKPKKKKKHRRDEDSIDALMNVDIKEEEEKIKKPKKSKKRETIGEEVENAVADKIKKEKDDMMSIKSPRILNLSVDDDSDSDYETSEVKLEVESRKFEKRLDSADKTEVKKEDDTSKRKKSKKNKSNDKNDETKCSRGIKDEKEKCERKKSKNIEEVKDDGTSDSHEFRTPTVKSEKSRAINVSRSSDETGELSDASVSRSRILIKKEESVFFGNIKIKQEPYPSDVEFLASKKRQRVKEGDSSDKNNGIDGISIKNEENFVKSEECVRTKKIKNENSDNSIVKDEGASSNHVKSKKKTKTTFSE